LETDEWIALAGIAAPFVIGLVASWVGLIGGGMKRLEDVANLSAAIQKARPQDRPLLEARFFKLLRRGHFPRRGLLYAIMGGLLGFGGIILLLRSVCARTEMGRRAAFFIAFLLLIVEALMFMLLRRYVQSGEVAAGSYLFRMETAALRRMARHADAQDDGQEGPEGTFVRWAKTLVVRSERRDRMGPNVRRAVWITVAAMWVLFAVTVLYVVYLDALTCVPSPT
jgi:hypothetical protein